MNDRDEPPFAEERRRMIVELVSTNGRVRIGELARTLNVTEPTVRKDLARLEQAHQLRRTHGGAIAVSQTEPAFDDRLGANPEAKTAIATECLRLIEPGHSVYFDSGTTVLRIAELLSVQNVSVLTSGLAAAMAVGDKQAIRHTLLGGQVRPAGGSVSGPLAVQNLKQFSVGTAFIGVTGITAEGITVADYLEAQLKAAVIDRSARVVVPLDASKVGAVDFATVVGLDRIDTVVTHDATDELRAICAPHGIQIIDAA
jgi:DeoR/GlpR family transcriptional regulator of sugar metabolism